jgi:hypothetical protein
MRLLCGAASAVVAVAVKRIRPATAKANAVFIAAPLSSAGRRRLRTLGELQKTRLKRMSENDDPQKAMID